MRIQMNFIYKTPTLDTRMQIKSLAKVEVFAKLWIWWMKHFNFLTFMNMDTLEDEPLEVTTATPAATAARTPLRSITTKTVGKSVAAKRNTAKNHFKEFFEAYRDSINDETFSTELDDHEAEEFDANFIGCIVAYVQDNSNMKNTAKGKFSNIKIILEEKFSTNSPLVVRLNDSCWQNSIQRYFNEKCLKSGEPLERNHIPMNATDQILFCKYLFEKGLHEECTLQSWDWSNGGRISEGPGFTWKRVLLIKLNTQKERRCCIKLNWFRGKTDTLTATFHFMHALQWLLCVLHSAARQCVLSNSADHEHIFPILKDKDVSKHMNKLWKDTVAAYKVKYAAECAVNERNRMEHNIYPLEEPYQITEGATLHGGRAAFMTQLRNEIEIPECAMKLRAGLSGKSLGHRGEVVDVYTAVMWRTDAMVRYCLLKLMLV